MTSSASLHFGPEWMRKPARMTPNSPNGAGSNTSSTVNGFGSGQPLNGTTTAQPNFSPATTTTTTQSSYSSLLASPMPQEPKNDSTNPFRYSREQMLNVWKNGGGQGELGLEVERWAGIVKEIAGEPLALVEMTPEEKRLYSLPLNSDPPTARRRGDSYSIQTASNSIPTGTDAVRDRRPSVGMGHPSRRKKDDPAQDSFLYRPRQLSLGSTAPSNGPLSPGAVALPSTGVPRPRPTAGFDGVLGDPWTLAARRRPSDPRSATVSNRVDEKLEGSWRAASDPRFREEITEEPGNERDWDAEPDLLSTQPATDALGALPNQNEIHFESMVAPRTASSRPTEPYDPYAVSWSYKDHGGQIQGPFDAASMQGWYESGYFFDGLPMKRNDIDSYFEPLEAYKRRVIPPGTAESLFLSQIASKTSPAPPGLAPQTNSALPSASVGPLIDRYFSADSTPMSINNLAYAPTNNGGYMGASDHQSILSSGYALHGLGVVSDAERARREREDFLRSLREQEMASNTPDHANHPNQIDPSSFGLGMGASASSQRQLNGDFRQGNFGVAPIQPDLTALSPVAIFGQQPFQQVTSPTYAQNNAYDPMNAPSSMLGQSPVWEHTAAVGIDDRAATFGIRSGSAQASSSPSPWQTVIEAATSWNQQPLSDVNDHTQTSLHTFPDLPQSFTPSMSVDQSLTTSTQQSIQDIEHFDPAPVDEMTDEFQNLAVDETLQISGIESSPPPGVNTFSPSELPVALEPNGGPEGPAAIAVPPSAKPVWSTIDEKNTTSISLRKIQEVEARKSAEAKRAEKDRLARLAATTTATAGSSPSSVTSPLDTANSWGLPQVGRAGPQSATSPSSSGGPTAASVIGAWANRAAPSVKKTMKEIQEEEAKRKKETVQTVTSSSRGAPNLAGAVPSASATAAASTKRGYADSAKVLAANAPAGVANGWATVGASGKVIDAPNTTPTVPAPAPRGATAPTLRSAAASSIAGPSSVTPAKTSQSSKASSSKPLDDTPPPSLEFIRWMREALRGLTGANIDEFMQMLLSFPLDPPPSVMEIISDSVYANSGTLDGRRFATEFVAKRKADAVLAKSGDAKQFARSLADVVKTQNKPAESEWSTKIVKKKNKGKSGNHN